MPFKVNPDIARNFKLDNGDFVVLKNQSGIVSRQIKVRITDRIRNDCVYMVHGFGRNDKRLRTAFISGADDNVLLSDYAVDLIMGGTGSQINLVTFVK